MSIDLTSLIQQVMERALLKWAGENSVVGGGDSVTEELLVDVLADRLVEMLQPEDSPALPGTRNSELDYALDELADYEELVERNSTLASALGACDCWGLLEGCDVCYGAGKPGWTIPDRRLFSILVRPAIRAMKVVQ